MLEDVIHQGLRRNTLSLEFQLFYNSKHIRIKRIDPKRKNLNDRLYEYSRIYTDWSWQTSTRNNVLMEASCDGCLEIVQLLMSNPSTLAFYERDPMKFYWALVYASLYGHLDVIKFLFESKIRALLDTGSFDLDTASNYAIQYGHLDVVKYLIGEGADKIRALKSAITHNRQEIEDYLSPLIFPKND